jgi:DNA polymerase III sliding clamp (beta) subunit (PCNA family)
MELNRVALVSALSKLKPAVGGKTGQAVFTWLLMAPGPHGMTLRTCSEHLSVEIEIAATDPIAEPVAVVYQTLADAVGAMSDATIVLDVVVTALVLRGQHAEVELETVSADQYPDPPRMPSARDITTMGRDGWIDLLAMMAPAAAKDSTRPMLASVLVGEHAVAAADGYRAHMSGSTYGSHVLLPPTMVGALVTALKGAGDGKYTLRAGEFWAAMTIGSATISGRLVAGTYPQLGRIIEPLATATPRATITIKVMLEALKIAMALRSELAIVRLQLEGNELTLSAKPATGASKALARVTVAGADHADWQIAVNGAYLRDALNAMAIVGTMCQLVVIDGKTPLGLNNGEAWAVVMPMTVGVV